MKMIVFDLDDTLFNEVDFVDSSYRFIANQLEQRGMLNRLLAYAIMRDSRDMRQAIERVRMSIGSSAPPESWFVEMYRTHKPNLTLDSDTLMQLRTWRNVGYRLGIITDGRSLTQGNKIHALGLDALVEPRNIIISEEIGADKTTDMPFKKIMERNPEVKHFTYVGDNPEKDFHWPNRLGWATVMLKSNGRNLKSQKLDDFDEIFHPQRIVDSIAEVVA